jgi:HEAT repeat protein
MTAWRGAIAHRDPDVVTKLDTTFREQPDQYTGALVESARSDGDERVRAFSTRVLGKLGRGELAPVFSALLADASPYVRLNAAWALGELSAAGKAPPATRATVASLKRLRRGDPDGDVRSAAQDALERLK